MPNPELVQAYHEAAKRQREAREALDRLATDGAAPGDPATVELLSELDRAMASYAAAASMLIDHGR